MPTSPPLVDVAPGDPITAESWNGILAAIKGVYDFLNQQRGTLVVEVTNQADGNPIRGALVTVSPTGGNGRPTRTAQFAGGSVNAYQVDQLAAGAYDLLVEADGFTSQTRSITMPDTGDPLSVEVPMAVTEARFPIPNLFGVQLSQALANITGQGFSVGRVIDAHGTDVTLTDMPPEVASAMVLGQWPAAGTLAPKTVQLFLNVSAKAEYLQRVAVPDLRGLSLEDAKALLEAHGLSLGVTTTVGT
jgi:hypothetical protein